MESQNGREQTDTRFAVGDTTDDAKRDEKTLLGSMVTLTRNLIQGEVHSTREQQLRNKSDEEIAHVTADVVASLPVLHILAAGTIRAISLVDLNAGIKQNFYTGIENFAEGAGLNKLSRLSEGNISSWRKDLNSQDAGSPGVEQVRWAVHDLPGATTQVKLDSQKFNLERPEKQLNVLSETGNRDRHDAIYGQLAFNPLPFPSTAELEARLILPDGNTASSIQWRIKPFSTDIAWHDEAHFNSQLEPYALQMSVYGVKGIDQKPLPIEIHVPVEHDQNVVRPIRALRQLAATPLAVDNEPAHIRQFFWNFPEGTTAAQSLENMPPDIKKEIVDKMSSMTDEERQQIYAVYGARKRLGEGSPDSNAILPEDIIPFLDQTKHVRTIVLSDRNWERDTWMRQLRSAKYHNPNFTAAATADHARGLITFFKGKRPDPLRPHTIDSLSNLFNHEDTHLMREHKPEYDAAYQLESASADMHSVSNYALLNEEEDRAESRTTFLAPDPDGFWEFALKAPVRAAILAKAESANLARFSSGVNHPYSEVIGNRIAYIDEHVLPQAQATARQYLTSADPKLVLPSVRVLGLIGGEEDISELERISQFDARVELTINRMEAARRGEAPESYVAQMIANNHAMSPLNQRNIIAKEAREALIKLRLALIESAEKIHDARLNLSLDVLGTKNGAVNS